MKKLFLIAIVAVFGYSTTYGQQDVTTFGVKAGVNFAKLTGDAIEDADGRTGFHVGGVVEIPTHEKLAIQLELLYSQQGLQAEDSFGEYKLKLDYLNIPIMGKFYVAQDFAIETGPQLGFLMNAKAESEGAGGSADQDVKDFISSFDIGFGAGLSYNMQTGLFFQARYVLGLSNVPDEDGDEGLFNDDVNNSVLSLSIGYKF